MEKRISIRLTGHPSEFPFDDDAYQLIQEYFEQARIRLADDPDRDEVLGDIEGSIGNRLASVGEGGPISRADLERVLSEIGPVDTGNPDPPPPLKIRGRFICRIKEDQKIAGVCTGLSAYLEYDVNWIRTFFVILAIFTGGGWVLAYVALMFLGPVVETRADYERMRDAPAV